MNTENGSFTEFLDDYYSESEEHLSSIRRHLLVLEGFVNSDDSDPTDAGAPATIDELLRALHSIKGLSGMVGIREAEQAAHDLEVLLRDLIQSGKAPTNALMETLSIGTSTIEQVIASRKEHIPETEASALPPQRRLPRAGPCGPMPNATTTG